MKIHLAHLALKRLQYKTASNILSGISKSSDESQHAAALKTRIILREKNINNTLNKALLKSLSQKDYKAVNELLSFDGSGEHFGRVCKDVAANTKNRKAPPDLLVIKARCALKTGNIKKAKKLLEAAYEKRPSRRDIYTALESLQKIERADK